MKTKPSWLYILVGILLFTSACSLFSSLVNPVDKAVSEIEDLATQVDVDQLEEGLETLATELPSTLEDLGDLGDIQATAEALEETYISGEAPADIPRVDERQDLLVSQEIVSYSTAMSFDDVLAFYQEQMLLQEWNPTQENNVITDETVILSYEKANRTAFVTLSVNPVTDDTVVLVTIQEK